MVTEKEIATINAKKAAQYLGVSYWKLLELCKGKEIPHLRVGNRLLFRISTLNLWMESQEKVNMKIEPSSGYGKLRKIQG